MEWMFLFYLAVPVAFAVFTPPVRRWLARRAAERRAAGEAVRLGAYLRGERPPFPRRWRQGSLDTGVSPVAFRPWHRRGPVPLSGLALLRREGGGPPNAPEEQTVFRMRDPRGGIVELSVPEPYSELVHELLRAAPPPPGAPPPRRRVPLWARVAAGLGAAWAAGWLVLYAAGDTTTARVLSNHGDGYCDVEWEHGGRAGRGEVDCDGEDPDDRLRVLLLPPPFRGNAVSAAYAPGYAAGPALLSLVPAAVSAVLNRRRRSRRAAPGAPALVAEAEAPPRLERWELRFSRIAETAERRALAEGWYDAEPARDRSPADAGFLRRRVGRSAAWLLLPLLTAATTYVGLESLARFPASGTWIATATVETVSTAVPFALYDLGVDYDAGGRTVEATVTSTRRVDSGGTLLVRYDPDDPSVARVAGPDDGTGRAARLLGASFVVAAGMAWRAAWAARREMAVVARVRALPPRTMRYALTRDADGVVHALLAEVDGDPRPDVTVPLWASPGIPVPATGIVEVRGEVADGSRPLLTVAGRDLYPDVPAFDVDSQILQALVNGDAVREPEDG